MAKTAQLTEIWPALQGGVSQLLTDLTKDFPFDDWMNLYTHVHDYCTSARQATAKHSGRGTSGAYFGGEDLYYKLVDFLTQHMKKLLADTENKMDEPLLVFYREKWDHYTAAMSKVNHIFTYLNRHWIKRESEDGQKDVYEIYPLSLVIWRDNLFKELKGRLTKALLAQIEKDRNGEQVNSSLLKGVIEGFVQLGLTKDRPKETTLTVYKEHFETAFIERTEIYYTQESSAFIEANSIADYMKKVEVRLHEEVQRVQKYLHVSTQTDLSKKCEQVLIEKHMDSLQAEFAGLLRDDKTDDLTRMHKLLGRIEPGLPPLRKTFEKHVLDEGLQAIHKVRETAKDNPQQYVEELLKVYRKYNEMVETAFSNDSKFAESLEKACRRFINENAVTTLAKSVSKSPELVARFVDGLLKKGSRPDDQETEKLLTDVMVIFKFIEEHDVFMTFYAKQLSRRLTMGTSKSEDMEGVMIEKLKGACGYEYTAKLQRMFTDVSLSRDLNDEFKSAHQVPVRDFSAMILAMGSWPLQAPVTAFNLPVPLQECLDTFKTFYLKKHTGRKLTWLHQHCKGELSSKGMFSKPYQLHSSAYQIGILLQFNDKDKCTYDGLKESSGLSEELLQRTLRVLCRTRVLASAPSMLKKNEQGQVEVTTPGSGHKFAVNKALKSKNIKVNINVPEKAEKAKQDKVTEAVIQEDRKLHMQAAIVRVMKMRKELQHNVLITEVIKLLQNRFKPSVTMIKRCIDSLIEKEYLERCPGKNDHYRYLA